MALIKREYTDEETIITAKNLNDIQDAVLALEDGLFAMDNDKSGEVITITDASNRGLLSLNIYGKTTQNGTPTPTAPVDLVNVGGGGSITVNVSGANDSRSMTISTPNGLPGIPVTSGGNYTDANGQQWICDEIDLARGVYVHRTKSGNLYEYIDRYCAPIDNTQYSENVLRFDFGNVFDSKVHTKALCNRFAFRFAHGVDIATVRVQEGVSTHSTGDFISVFIDKNRLVSATLDGLKTYLQNNATIVLCAINTPIETPLSAEELAAYASLRTYKDLTTVSNDASAYMGLEYVMDAKKYIDRIAGSSGGGGGSVAKLSHVTLRASAWAGSGSLYSQVVSIDGVTENSQVNLTPSVEQLSIFYDKDITFVTENDGGVVTVYVIGQKPQNDYTIPANIVEVIV